MGSAIHDFFALVREPIRAESDNWAGRVNFLGLVAIFLLIFVPGEAVNIVQVIIRIWKPHYTTGMPSAISLAITYGVLLLLCVLILTVMEVLTLRRGRS